MPLLSLTNLVKDYQTDEGMFGKTTLGRMILRLIESTSGAITA